MNISKIYIKFIENNSGGYTYVGYSYGSRDIRHFSH